MMNIGVLNIDYVKMRRLIMVVIKVDDLNRILNQQKEKIKNEIHEISNKNGIWVLNYRNYLEGKLRLIDYLENVIEILKIEN